ncbi:hypothetical protein L1049_006408 [Liquidambar formosana]|uniref:Core-2/I-branching beta-1,6-N-acetylglucosaminyltransferase family protein n=1 Tax=Liquidambar formosana TaxID=63359 RepID=A0AAP0RIE0_LIQFO
MKRCKITVLVKELSIRIKREVREGSFQITTTIILCLSMAFLVVILGMFINDRVRKFMVSEDYYLPQLTKFSPLSPLSAYSYLLCNSSSSLPSLPPVKSSTRNRGLRDAITLKGLWHSMSDQELMWRASMVPHMRDYPYNRTPKVAFMFLSRGALPLAPLWEKFFKGHEGLYSIYLHTSPEFTNELPESSAFYRRKIPSKPVEWGRASMIDAERRLLANALLDVSNERFVLLSETCIPLFNFSTIYNYLLYSNYSFLSSFDEPRRIGRGRYNKRMWPTVSLSEWRKGSQWFEIHRKLAIEIVSDITYYPVFREYCKPPCYMDEHYLATLVNKLSPDLNSNRSITWVDWSRGGSHPTRFVRKDVSEGFLNHVRHGFNCTYNGSSSSICFLFARKFHPSTLEPLLRIAPELLGFDP